ncbi:MAG: tetratricopeptide repeat protein [Salinivirgaceae bacterium]|jgi:tetratricopeptide (TPR) repeat protein|nr:tetratricopeptide repeat protein [Salinivirgaceae bacterium]
MQIIKKHAPLWLFAIAFLVYANTLQNEYALDDAIVITQNSFVKKGLSGIDDIFTTESFTGFFGFDKQLVAGGRYRPLSLATFAVEYEFFGKQPFISHLINVILFALIVLLIYQILSRLGVLPYQLAFLIALLYALHPIHTEAVANIKGRDELLAFLLILGAVYRLLIVKSRKIINLLGAGALLFLAMLSKEHAIAFVALIPLGMYYLRYKSSEIFQVFGVLLLFGMVFFSIRFYVLDGVQITESSSLMNNPFINMSGTERYATILLTWLWYLQLLIFPHPLTYDYYPYHVPVANFTENLPWLGLVVVLVLLFFAIRSLINRRFYGFWIWFFIGSFLLMSNLFISIGTFMNERFLFIPSLSFCVFIGFGIHYLLINQKLKQYGFGLLAVFMLGYSVKTISRNTIWKNDFTLFTHDVKISQNSAKGNCVAGGQYYEKAVAANNEQEKQMLLQKARGYLKKSLSIHPTYNDAHLLYGNTQFGLKQPLDSVMPSYFNIFTRAPRHSAAWKNALAVMHSGNPENRLKWYKKLHSIDSNRFEITYNLGKIYGRHLQNYPKAEQKLLESIRLRPNNIKALKDIAVVYGLTGQYQESVEALQKVVKSDPNDAQAWFNLGLSLNALGQKTEAQKALDKAHQLDPSRKRIVLK